MNDSVYSCPAHPGRVVDGWEPCRVISQDILHCSVHDNVVEGCAACDAIDEIWIAFALAVWKDCDEKPTSDVLEWAPWHEPRPRSQA